MIPELAPPQYYVTSVDMDVTPSVGETIVGSVGSTFELSEPRITTDPDGFQCQADLSLSLYERGYAPWDVDNDSVTMFGEIDTSFLIHIPGEHESLENYVTAWQESDGYYDLDVEFRHHVESGVLQYIIAPVGEMLENSYDGVIPRIVFSGQFDDKPQSKEK